MLSASGPAGSYDQLELAVAIGAAAAVGLPAAAIPPFGRSWRRLLANCGGLVLAMRRAIFRRRSRGGDGWWRRAGGWRRIGCVDAYRQSSAGGQGRQYEYGVAYCGGTGRPARRRTVRDILDAHGDQPPSGHGVPTVMLTITPLGAAEIVRKVRLMQPRQSYCFPCPPLRGEGNQTRNGHEWRRSLESLSCRHQVSRHDRYWRCRCVNLGQSRMALKLLAMDQVNVTLRQM
jgi:hypothetical protein